MALARRRLAAGGMELVLTPIFAASAVAHENNVHINPAINAVNP